jgi:uncharacterized membrane protein YecN with MAPEG domain
MYAALAALILIALSVNVIRSRRHHGAALGDSAGPEMTRRIRAQANFIEYTPIFLIMLFLAEKGGIPGWSVHVLGSAFFLGRLMHAYSLLKDERYSGNRLLANPAWRVRGMGLTFVLLGLLAAVLMAQYFLAAQA